LQAFLFQLLLNNQLLLNCKFAQRLLERMMINERFVAFNISIG